MLNRTLKISALSVLAVAGALAGAAGVAIADPSDGKGFRGPPPMGPGGGLFAEPGDDFGPGPGRHDRHRRHERVRQHVLERFDANADGQLDQAEREAAHAAFAAEHPEAAARMREHHQRVLERFDADKNGTLDESERAAAHEFGRDRMRERRHERHDAMRERFDTNNDGVIDDAERQAARELGRERAEKHHAMALQKFDANADGALSAEERKAAREFHHARMRERHEAILAEFDADKDGRLSPEERDAARPTLRQRRIAMGNFFGIDANNDRAIDAAEMTRGMELIRDADIRADFNGDGQINEADAAALLEKASEPKPGNDA